jgi:hypothetical protein
LGVKAKTVYLYRASSQHIWPKRRVFCPRKVNVAYVDQSPSDHDTATLVNHYETYRSTLPQLLSNVLWILFGSHHHQNWMWLAIETPHTKILRMRGQVTWALARLCGRVRFMHSNRTRHHMIITWDRYSFESNYSAFVTACEFLRILDQYRCDGIIRDLSKTLAIIQICTIAQFSFENLHFDNSFDEFDENRTKELRTTSIVRQTTRQ